MSTMAVDLNSDDAIASIDREALAKRRHHATTVYKNDHASTQSSDEYDNDNDDDDDNDNDDDNDEDFIEPINKKSKKKGKSTTSTLKSGTTSSSIKKKKIASEKLLNEKINTLKVHDLLILIRAYPHEQATDKSKPDYHQAHKHIK